MSERGEGRLRRRPIVCQGVHACKRWAGKRERQTEDSAHRCLHDGMHFPWLVLVWIFLVEAQTGWGLVAALTAEKDTENSGGRTKRQPPLSRAPRAVQAAAAEAVAVAVAVATKEQHRDSLERTGGGLRQNKQQPQLRQEHKHHQRPPGAQAPPDPDTATAAAAAAAKPAAPAKGEQRQSETQSTESERILAEFEIAEGGRLAGVGTPLVPSFCPSEPFERYAAMHWDIMAGKLEPRYLVFRPYLQCGMGNRLKGYRGVLGLAMMTDRALLVDWYGGLDSSRSGTEHKFEDNFLEAGGVPWDIFPSSLEGYDSGYHFKTEVWCQIPNGFGVKTPCDKSRMTPDFLGTADWDEIYAKDTQVVVVQSHNHNPMDLLRVNKQPSVARALGKLHVGVDPDVFGTCALRFLLKPRPDFKERYCEERSAVLGGKTASISLHLRTGDNPHYHPEWYKTLPADLENFTACATGLEEGLAMVAAMYATTPGPDFDIFSTFKERGDLVWLLGTDSSEVIDLLTKGEHTVAQGGKMAFVEGDEFHRSHSGSKGGKGSNNAGPLIDLALLSEAPLLVGSYCSTFSQNTAEIGGLPVPLRLFLSTPFHHLLGGSHVDWDRFDDFRQGCRDVVSDPSSREHLRVALKTNLEPWIRCDDLGG